MYKENGFLELAFLSMTEEQRAEIKTLLKDNQKQEYELYDDKRKGVEKSASECI